MVTPATGAYTLTLLDNVLHAVVADEENATDPTTNLIYSITDADGSSTTGTLTVTWDDDAPTATAEPSQNVAEGATVTGTLDFVQGADGASVTHIGGIPLVFNPGRELLAAARHRRRHDQGEGGRVILVHGRQPGAGAGSASASFTVTDGDGDTVTVTGGISFHGHGRQRSDDGHGVGLG